MAILGFRHKFRNFEASILPLLPQTGGRRRDRLTRVWDAWRNNTKAEESILDLHNNIVKVMRRYMMASTTRIEVKQRGNHQETIRGLTDIHNNVTQGLQVLEVVQRDVSAIAAVTVPLYPYESSRTTSNEFNHSIIMFAQSSRSTSAPMLRTPEMITEEVATTVYIKVQIDSIAMIVKKILMLPASTQNSVSIFSWTPIVEERSMDIMHLRHHVVQGVIGIRDLLDSRRLQTIFAEGITSLNNLSVALGVLHMPHEASLVGDWAVTLARILVDASADKQPELDAHLAFCLLNQSIEYSNRGDDTHSLQVAMEAYSITQNLRNQHGGETRFQILHSNILMQYAELVGNQQSIKMCIEAIHILEDILNIQAFAQSKSCNSIERVIQPCSSFLDNLFSSASPKTGIVVYAWLLQKLGTYLFADGHPDSALGLQLLALAVHRKLVSIYGHEWKTELAQALSSLLQDGTADHMPLEEVLNIAEECIQLLREFAEKNPPSYARKLVDVLWVKATVLQKLGRDTEAITTWEGIAGLASQIIQDSALCARALGNLSNHFRHLKRHDDAARTGKLAITMYHEEAETQAARYLNLSKDLRELHRYKESVEAAQTAVTLYRHLAMRNPGKWMGNLPASLSDLAHCLAASGDYSEALISWKECMSMLEKFLHADSDAHSESAIDMYCVAIWIHPSISHILMDEEKSLEVSCTAVQYLCQLSEICPSNTSTFGRLLWAEFHHVYNMLRVGRLQDAQQYIDNRIDGWRSKPEAYSIMLRLKVLIFDAQGCTQQALLITQSVRDIAKLSASTLQPCFYEMIRSMHHEARLLGSLGDSGEAFRVAEGALQLARDNKLEDIVSSLVWSLHVVAFTALLHRNYNRAVEAAREGCDILARPEGLKFQDQHREFKAFVCPSMFAILSSAEANLGRCGTAVEYANRAIDASLEIGKMKATISVTTAEWSYMETSGNLAEIILATGGLARARQICDERRVYFLKRVETRMGDYRELAPILRMFGVLCCSEGSHEEGDAAAKELSRIIQMLGSTFPSLQEQVKIRLRHQAEVPILKVLNDMCHNLDCEHQAEVVSLFSI